MRCFSLYEDYAITNVFFVKRLLTKSRIFCLLNRSKADKILNVNDSNGYTVLSFELILQRKMVFSSYILTMPCVFLASLTLIVFCLPPERPDRTGLGRLNGPYSRTSYDIS